MQVVTRSRIPCSFICTLTRQLLLLQDNYPEMELTCLDLSFPYLENARENLQYWRSKRAPNNNTVDTFIQVTDAADGNLLLLMTCVPPPSGFTLQHYCCPQSVQLQGFSV